MVPVFEYAANPNISEADAPLEARIPNEFREHTGRHMANTAFLDGFSPLGEPGSQFEEIRQEMITQIIEQPDAIEAIISSLDKWEVRNDNDQRPVASLAFLGPTGVGKSETAKALAFALGKGDANLLRIDCSNYSSGHEVAGLTGSPPGYVGREQKPVLSKRNVEAYGTVVLFDEIEKGSKELFNLLLQVMDAGELRLNNGQTTSFRDAIIIFTSNLGAKELSALMGNNPIGFGAREAQTDKAVLNKTATKAFEEFFQPEFTNRIDKLVVFHPLSAYGLAKVLKVKLDSINDQYEDDFGMRISLTDATIEHLVGIAQKQPQFGARPMVRAFEESIQTTFGRYVGLEDFQDGTHVRVFHRNDFPDDYQDPHNRELIFATKPDSSIKKKVIVPDEPSKEVTLFTQPDYNITDQNSNPNPDDDTQKDPTDTPHSDPII